MKTRRSTDSRSSRIRRQFRLEPDQSGPVSISVGLPSTPTRGPADAGTVTIRGQDERDLVVWIRAEVDARLQIRRRRTSRSFRTKRGPNAPTTSAPAADGPPTDAPAT